MDWLWTGQYAEKMKSAVLGDDWGTVAMLSAQIAQKFGKIEIAKNHRLGRPWVGAYGRINGQS
jgi:hypothetical protein